MTLQSSSKTVYAAARGDQFLSEGYDTPEEATQQAAHLSEHMTAAGLEPDIRVVEVTVTTKVGRPKLHEPKAAVAEMTADMSVIDVTPTSTETTED